MGACLYPAAEDREHAGVGGGQRLGCRGRHRSGAHLGDQAAIEQCQRLARLGREQQDHGQMGRQPAPGVARVESHELGAHGVGADRRHDPEEASVAIDREQTPHRLLHAPGGEVDQRTLHGRDQRVPRQVLAHLVLVEEGQHGGWFPQQAPPLVIRQNAPACRVVPASISRRPVRVPWL
jgi:hypothetical protein